MVAGTAKVDVDPSSSVGVGGKALKRALCLSMMLKKTNTVLLIGKPIGGSWIIKYRESRSEANVKVRVRN